MCVVNILLLYIISAIIECAVLDPALYLSPSPPLIETSKDIPPSELWSKLPEEKTERDDGNPLVSTTENEPNDKLIEESMDSSETIWPLLRNIDYSVKEIHIPLTFSVSGTYGNNKPGFGVVSSVYGTVPRDTKTTDDSEEPALAGSGYNGHQTRHPVVRIYGRDSEPAWGGWGNGKWGQYGKG